MPDKKVPTYVYRYEVVSSNYEPVRVGAILVDARRELVKDWTILDTRTGKAFDFVGQRRERMCSECFVLSRSANLYNHDGEHGVTPVEETISRPLELVDP